MTETTKNSGEKLSVAPTKTLTLKRGGVEQGVVRQSFSHGPGSRCRAAASRRRACSGRQSRARHGGSKRRACCRAEGIGSRVAHAHRR
jgi:translation initiation factor IF-2